MRAVASGQFYNNDSLIVNLTKVISDFKSYPVADLARVYLSNFSNEEIKKSLGIIETDTTKNVISLVNNEPKQQDKTSFVYNPSEQHYVVLLVKTAYLPLQTVKLGLTDFNKEFFSLKKLIISSFFIDNERQMVTISKFNDGNEAMDYYSILVKNDKYKGDIQSRNIEVYVMSGTNYTTFYNKRDERDSYPQFFNDNYLKKE